MNNYPGPSRYYRRLTLNQRVQHVVLMICVATLIVTGMPVFYSDAAVSHLAVRWMGGGNIRGQLHRAAAVLLLTLGFYHLLYCAFSQRGREEFLALLPRRKDLADLKTLFRYYLTSSAERPQFGRYSFFEKFEYFAVGWGIVVMGITGLMLWFPEKTMLFFPKWVVDIARTIHSYEALLAFLTIIIWHFYNVHLGPEVFPMSLTWLNGLISEERMRREHPQEFALVADQEHLWVTIPVTPAEGLAGEAAPVASRLKRSVLAAGIGAGLGAIVPVLFLPCIALTIWLLNPTEPPWGASLLVLSLMLLPSALAGAAMGTYLGLGHSLAYSFRVIFFSLIGLFLGPLALWIPVAALIYVLGWFIPLRKVTTVVLLTLIIASLFLGLIGSVIGSLRAKRSLCFAAVSPPDDEAANPVRLPGREAGE